MADAKYKPLSFTTTLRNPERIAAFLQILAEFENHTLKNDVIMQIVKRILNKRLYAPTTTREIADIWNDEDIKLNDEQLKDIIVRNPQNHKEAGFDKGWPSRFDTWYNFIMELGFAFYEMGKPIVISNTGHMLVDAYNEETPNSDKVQAVFLNAMVKYQTYNPFRKTLNRNAPLILLLQVINLLHKDKAENGSGIARRELPLIICFPHHDAGFIYGKIKRLHKEYGYEYSDDVIYDLCFKMLGGTVGRDENYFKKEKIIKEAPDDFLRKIRMTGIVSFRGMGRFIDFNNFEINKINYILAKYVHCKEFETRRDYFDYMGQIDSEILKFAKPDEQKVTSARKQALQKWAEYYSKETVDVELGVLSGKGKSQDDILNKINEPTRLEFLTAIALKQSFVNLDVCPNYSVDDEGFPTFTAKGGVVDIECYDKVTNALFEVTLMRGKTQATNEMPAITRHLLEVKEKTNNTTFSILITPMIHFDTTYMVGFSKQQYGVDIIPLTITDFIAKKNEYIAISAFAS